MDVVLNLPEDIARDLQAGGADLSRTALEAIALEGARSRKLSAAKSVDCSDSARATKRTAF
jgi:hypothetical protein